MESNFFSRHLYYTKNETTATPVTPYGILVGQIGVGKSTIFNLITNQSVEAGEGGTSLTRQVFSSLSSYGQSFRILDTPGTQSDVDKLQHGIHLRLALTESPLSRIFVLITYAARPAIMARELSEALEFLSEWKELITVVVTYWDKENDDKSRQLFEGAKTALLNQFPGLPDSFIFSGIDADPAELCNAFYNQLSLCTPKQLEISERYFLLKFDLYNNMKIEVKEFITSFKKISNQILTEIMEFKDQDSKDEFFHSCIVIIQQISESMMQDFYNKYGVQMTTYDNYIHYLQLKKEFMPIVKQVRTLAAERMSFNLMNNKSPQNMIKQCPNCGLYWLKVEGCDGRTTCGNRVSSNSKIDMFKDRGYQAYHFSFKWDDGFTWQQEIYKPVINIDSKAVKDASKGTAQGCGASIIWSMLPLLCQEKLDELKDIGLSDFLSCYQEENKAVFEKTLYLETQKAKINRL